MKALGFERKLLNFDGRPQRGYARGDAGQQEKRIFVVHNPPSPPIAGLSEEEVRVSAEEAARREPM
jgi:hypothetical protein